MLVAPWTLFCVALAVHLADIDGALWLLHTCLVEIPDAVLKTRGLLVEVILIHLSDGGGNIAQIEHLLKKGRAVFRPLTGLNEHSVSILA